jgi:hypothetical protein
MFDFLRSFETAPFYIPNSTVQGFWLLHVLTNTCHLSVFFLF